MRMFEDKPAVRVATPLLVGLTGVSSSGKTYSALRIATGIQRVVGGELFFIDTEHRRGLHYADMFRFRHIDMKPPHGPLDYLAAIEHCVARGAKVIVIDSMTHEHSGDGGVLDQSEKYLESKPEAERNKHLMASLIKPKAARKKLNRRIVQLGINAVFCYRAVEKLKPKRGGEPEKLGWQPETTSPLHYDMTIRFLLGPGSNGVPTLSPENPAEKLHTKLPEQFRGKIKEGSQLSEGLGEMLARWAAGDDAAPAAPSSSAYVFPGGSHKGKAITDVPADYLGDLVHHDGTPEHVRKLAEDEIQRRMDEEHAAQNGDETT